MVAKTKKRQNRYVVLIVLCICESMYLLPYLRWTFYDTMIEGFGFTNTQLATLGSVFGLMSLVGYFIGGPICDRFSPRKILTSAFILTGIGGFWFATYPPFWACIIIHILWGIATAILLWDCMIRLTRSLASSEEQGRFFGLLEGGRGAVDTIASFVLVALFASLGSTVASLQQVMYILAAFNIIGVILVLLFIDSETLEKEDEASKINIHDIAAVLKTPAVWLIALVILCNYSVYTGGTYLTSYLTDIVGVSVAVSAIISVFRNYALMMLGGPIGGFLGDKFTISKVIIACFAFVTVALAAFVFIPSNSLVIAVIMMMVLYTGLFFMRGIYFGTVDQAKIPMRITGTAVGLISLIGFFPEVFMNTISGYLLDTFPGYDGYHYLFIILLVFSAAGFFVSILLKKNIESMNEEK